MVLNKLLQQSENDKLPNEQADRIKIAFAEGYVAASGSEGAQKSSRTMKYFKVLQQLLITIVFLGIFASLFTSTNGSVFR